MSVISLSFFSAFTVALAFLQKVYVTQPGTSLDNYLTALSACLGVFLLVISLIEWGAAVGTKADNLYRNAEELNKLQHKIGLRLAHLEANGNVEWAEVETLFHEYELIKERCAFNHDPIDDLAFQAEHRSSIEFSMLPADAIGSQQSTESLNDENIRIRPKIGFFRAAYIRARYWFSSIIYFAVFWVVIIVLSLATFFINK